MNGLGLGLGFGFATREKSGFNILTYSDPDAVQPTGWGKTVTLTTESLVNPSRAEVISAIGASHNMIRHEVASGGRAFVSDTITLSAGNWTLSLYVDEDLSSGVADTRVITDLNSFTGLTGTDRITFGDRDANGRCQATFSIDDGDTTGNILIGTGALSNHTGTFVFGGWQLEPGTTAGPYTRTQESPIT